jgi:hypothetical protein
MLSLRGQNLKTLRAVALAMPVVEGGGGQGTSAWRPADYVAPVQRFLKPAWALLFNRPGGVESKRTKPRLTPSLEDLDELLTRQANRRHSPAPIYRASTFAFAEFPDTPGN